MDWIRTYWPTLLALLLVLYFLLIAFRRRDPEGKLSRWNHFRGRNEEGAIFLVVLLLFLILLAGAQVGLRRTAAALGQYRERTDSWAESIRRENQEWSIRLREAEAERDSFRTKLERMEEMREAFTFEGRIVDQETGAPLSEARVDIYRFDPERRVRKRLVAEGIRTGEDGRFSLLAPRPGPAGSLRLEIHAGGYTPFEAWIPSADLGSLPHTITLPR